VGYLVGKTLGCLERGGAGGWLGLVLLVVQAGGTVARPAQIVAAAAARRTLAFGSFVRRGGRPGEVQTGAQHGGLRYWAPAGPRPNGSVSLLPTGRCQPRNVQPNCWPRVSTRTKNEVADRLVDHQRRNTGPTLGVGRRNGIWNSAARLHRPSGGPLGSLTEARHVAAGLQNRGRHGQHVGGSRFAVAARPSRTTCGPGYGGSWLEQWRIGCRKKWVEGIATKPFDPDVLNHRVFARPGLPTYKRLDADDAENQGGGGWVGEGEES